ncbi:MULTISPECIES: methyl-accepting chemotaxis protein [Silvimonas]|uniref:methyl-accepting chemotaxis protein n=1 Tax=Silvimonas TaxID=300264 RepID=UPI0024B3493E|nr:MULTISPECIES: methyl-accepting chemotaxis protein [Silvimonas]MDR3427978.1 methyl-accepting chemotaxis protein [Silvimonas sp.]
MFLRTVRGKILVCYLVAASLVAAAAFVGIAGMQSSVRRYETEVKQLQDAQVQVLSMQVVFKIQVQEWKDTLLRGHDAAKLEQHWGAFQKQEAAVQESADHLQQTLPPGESADLVRQFRDAHKELGQGYRRGLEAFRSAGFVPAAGDAAVAGIDRPPTTLLTKAVASIGDESTRIQAQAHALAERQFLLSMIGMVVAVVAGLSGFYWLTTRTVTGPLSEVASKVQNITDNSDFTSRIAVTSNDEIGALGGALNTCLAHVQTALQRMHAVSGELSASAGALDGASRQLAQSTELQNQNTGSIAAAVEQIAVSLSHTSTEAHEAHALSQDAGDKSGQSAHEFERTENSITTIATLVEEAARDVDQLGKDSSEISGVLDVIKALASQTNLLALNAAIEAARAGEQGRGFAVVADEVRKLAEHTSQSTNQIQSTIQHIQDSVGRVVTQMELVVNRVDDCRSQASAAGGVVRKLHEASDRIVAAMGEVALAVREQSLANESISRNVELLAQSSEHNGAATRTAADQATNVSGLARQMKEIVAGFRI